MDVGFRPHFLPVVHVGTGPLSSEESMERQMTAQRLEERRAQKRQEVKENAAATRVQAAQRGNDDTEEATNTHAMPEEPIVEAASMPVAEAPAADSGAGIGAVSLGAGLLGAGMLASSSGALFGAPAPEPAKPKKKPVLSLAAQVDGGCEAGLAPSKGAKEPTLKEALPSIMQSCTTS